MGQAELVRLYNIQQKIKQQSELYYKDKPIVRKDDAVTLHKILRFAEDLFPDYSVMLYSEKSERIYISENVADLFQYSSKNIVELSDEDFLGKIHPDDLRPIREAMEKVYELELNGNYDHASLRYKMNLRYQLLEQSYAHITYEAVTIQYEGMYADIVLLKNVTHEQSFYRVELVVFQKTRSGLEQVCHFVPKANKDTITPREKEIIQWILAGLTTSEMANRMGISVNTVKNHRSKLFRKINIKSSLQLITYARKENIG
jgi:DNA-binding CsgD family transcriptional regulator